MAASAKTFDLPAVRPVSGGVSASLAPSTAAANPTSLAPQSAARPPSPRRTLLTASLRQNALHTVCDDVASDAPLMFVVPFPTEIV